MKSNLARRIGQFLFGITALFVLVALLYPIFAQADSGRYRNANSRRIVSLAQATLIYNADYHDFMPYARNDGEMFNARVFRNLIRPYVKSNSVFFMHKPGVRRFKPATSDFLYDSIAGLEVRRRAEIDPQTTLISPHLFEGQDPRKWRVRCVTYELQIKSRPWLECQADRTESYFRELVRP